MDFGQILSRGWNIVWQNKWMWLLGLLAALSGAANGGRSNALNTRFSNPQELQEFLGMDSSQWEAALERNLNQFIGVAVGLVSLLVLIGIALWLLSHAARAGMIKAAVALDKGQAMTWREALGGGWRYVLRLVLMNLALAAPIVVLVVAVAVVLGGAFGAAFAGGLTDDYAALFRALGATLACLTPLVCVGVLLGLALQFIGAFGYRGIVLRDLGVWDGIRHGWQVFRSRLGDSILLGLIFGVIGFVWSLAIGAILGGLALAGSAQFWLDAVAGRTITAGQFASVLGVGLLLGILTAVFNSILVAWRSSSVTLAYLEFTGGIEKEEAPEPPDSLIKAF